MPLLSGLRVVVVGPCASGKSVLAERLRRRGFDAQSVAQEHTVIHDLYRHLEPDVVVYLDVSYRTAAQRRDLSWPEERHVAQKELLEPVRLESDLYLPTDYLTEAEVEEWVLVRLIRRRRRATGNS